LENVTTTWTLVATPFEPSAGERAVTRRAAIGVESPPPPPPHQPRGRDRPTIARVFRNEVRMEILRSESPRKA